MTDDSRTDEALAWWLLGVAVAHALRFVVFDDPGARQVVAASGALIYGTGALLALEHAKVSRWISIVFPIVGLSTVLLTGEVPDHWQISVGVTQVAAMVYAIRKLFQIQADNA